MASFEKGYFLARSEHFCTLRFVVLRSRAGTKHRGICSCQYLGNVSFYGNRQLGTKTVIPTAVSMFRGNHPLKGGSRHRECRKHTYVRTWPIRNNPNKHDFIPQSRVRVKRGRMQGTKRHHLSIFVATREVPPHFPTPPPPPSCLPSEFPFCLPSAVRLRQGRPRTRPAHL